MNTKQEILGKHQMMYDKSAHECYEREDVYAAMEEYAAQFKDSPYQGSAGDQWQDEHLAEVTEIMRDADMKFATVGGGTRHYLRDLLFPMLQEKGLSICRAAVPAGDGWVSVQDDMPELKQQVIVARPNEFSKKVDILMAYLYDSGEAGRHYGRIDEHKWLYGKYWAFPAIAPLSDVTHWRPLPTPPNKSV